MISTGISMYGKTIIHFVEPKILVNVVHTGVEKVYPLDMQVVSQLYS